MGCGLTFLDLFAGAGGLSEGFIQAGFEPVAHVESAKAACNSLRTRISYHWLKSQDRTEKYVEYLEGILARHDFYGQVPARVLDSVINAEISDGALPGIFQRIDELLQNRRLDLIIGGPPCQAYSLVGRSRDRNKMKGDWRNYLYIHYAEFLHRYKPTFFVFENVTGLLSARDRVGHSYLQKMTDVFHQYGYRTEYETLSARDYGVPQNRRRIILVGRRGDAEGFYPKPDNYESHVPVGEFLTDLPPLKAGEGRTGPCRILPYPGTWLYDAGIRIGGLPVTWHQARAHTEQDLEIYRIAIDLWNDGKTRLDYNALPDHLKTHRNRRSFRDRFKVVASDLPYSQTVVAHIARDGHYYIHPDRNQNRSLTPREAARLQTFPDDYYFESSLRLTRRTPAFSQIGNAVPVLLARKLAEKLKENWK